MAVVRSLGAFFDTTAGTATNKFVTATPTEGDLIVVVVLTTLLSGGSFGVTDDHPDGRGTYTLAVGPAGGFGSDTGRIAIWIRNALIGATVSTVFTEDETGSSGGGLNVFSVTGMTLSGASAVYSWGVRNNSPAGQVPTMNMSLVPLDPAMPVIAGAANLSNPSNVPAQTSPEYTEAVNTGFTVPTLGVETMFVNTGEAREDGITWGGNSATAGGAVAVQLNTTGVDDVVQLTLVGHARRIRGG